LHEGVLADIQKIVEYPCGKERGSYSQTYQEDLGNLFPVRLERFEHPVEIRPEPDEDNRDADHQERGDEIKSFPATADAPVQEPENRSNYAAKNGEEVPPFLGPFRKRDVFDTFLNSSTVIREDLNSLKSFAGFRGGWPASRSPGGVAACHVVPFQQSQPDGEGAGCHVRPEESVTRRALIPAAN